jgi:hypothetical protein
MSVYMCVVVSLFLPLSLSLSLSLSIYIQIYRSLSLSLVMSLSLSLSLSSLSFTLSPISFSLFELSTEQGYHIQGRMAIAQLVEHLITGWCLNQRTPSCIAVRTPAWSMKKYYRVRTRTH